MELIACPYRDSRASSDKPINASALRETLKHWRPAVGLLARARSEVAVATAMDVWWAGQMAESLPYLLLFRHGRDVTVPGPVAAAYKAMLGTNAALLGFCLERAPAAAAPSVDEVLAHVEEHRLLVGPEQACAGPESLIRETLSVLIDGGARSEEADRWFDADAAAFGRARASLLVARLVFGLATHAIYADSAAGVNVQATRDQERFAAAPHEERVARIRDLVRNAVGGADLLRAFEEALAREGALARQQALEDACRAWIGAIKRRIVALLPEDAERDRELALSTVSLPTQTPLRRLSVPAT